jgi:uncharacterized protein with HEPN domain
MSRDSAQRCDDVIDACAAIRSHLQRGDLSDGLVFDAVRARLIEIGEAVKSIDATVLAAESEIPWVDIAGMRNHLAHRYFDTDHAIVQATIDHDLPPMLAATKRIRASLD